ncbi:hypothetical protein ACFE04_016676 [Oxalis oulophora]
MGRRKIDMILVEKLDSRQVTFSKQRIGVFKKANELAILCGIMVVVIIVSIGGKPYTFGNPDVKTVIDCFINDYEEEDNENQVYASANNLKKLKEELKELVELKQSLEKFQNYVNGKVKVKVKAMKDDLKASEALLLLVGVQLYFRMAISYLPPIYSP